MQAPEQVRSPEAERDRSDRTRQFGRGAARRCQCCGVLLSQYAPAADPLCWACRHRERMSLSEREARLRLLLAGAPVRHLSDPRYSCPRCGGAKTPLAGICAHCRFRAPHPKKKPRSAALRDGPCPVCGSMKSPKARLCRACWVVDQRVLFERNPARTCPDCGGAKVRNATRCRRCSDRVRYGTVYLGRRAASSICPLCGGRKKLKRARTCRACWRRLRRAGKGTYR